MLSELLIAAREVPHEHGWCQETYAQDAGGFYVNPTHASAIKFCAIGALHRALPVEAHASHYAHAISALTQAIPSTGSTMPTVYDFNDHFWTTKADVLALYDAAIARAA